MEVGGHLKMYDTTHQKIHSVCPGSSDPFYIVRILFKMGHYFLDTQYHFHSSSAHVYSELPSNISLGFFFVQKCSSAVFTLYHTWCPIYCVQFSYHV